MQDNLHEVKDKLDDVGCGFCLAKWTQVTLHLDKGMTHSCHHPAPHKIPLKELERDYKALHNTRFKKKQRLKMLKGERPDECNYCWNIEDNSDSLSDRVFKSAEPWSLPDYDNIKESSYSENFNPRYVEVSFANTCNFKCAYCGPQYSSKWVEEIEREGPYELSHDYNEIDSVRERDEMPYKKSEHNPYIEAFWKWWPELYQDLHTFRITGGEPLLSPDTWKLLEYIQTTDNPNPNLSLAINSNMGVPDKLINRLIEIGKDLTENNKVREFIIFTSVESEGEQSEYLRYGLEFDKFWNNIDKILTELPKVTVNIMATFNALSVFRYDDLIDKVFEMKKKHQNNQRYWVSALQLDTSYVRWPKHLSVKILPDELKELILKSAKKALYYGIKEFTHDNYGFSNTEIQKIKRLYDYAISDDGFNVELHRKDFKNFIQQYDRRRNVSFLDTFPELKEFYENIDVEN